MDEHLTEVKPKSRHVLACAVALGDLCALLATAVLAGLALNAGFGWWWADPVAGYVIWFNGVTEGRAALTHS